MRNHFFPPQCCISTINDPSRADHSVKRSQCQQNVEAAFSHWSTWQTHPHKNRPTHTGLWDTWLAPFLPQRRWVWSHDSSECDQRAEEAVNSQPGVEVTGRGRPFQWRAWRKRSEDVGSDQSGPDQSARWRLRPSPGWQMALLTVLHIRMGVVWLWQTQAFDEGFSSHCDIISRSQCGGGHDRVTMMSQWSHCRVMVMSGGYDEVTDSDHSSSYFSFFIGCIPAPLHCIHVSFTCM